VPWSRPCKSCPLLNAFVWMAHIMIRHRLASTAKVLALALTLCLAGCGSGSSSSTSPTTSPSHSTPKPVPMPTVLGYSVPLAMQAVKAIGLEARPNVKMMPNGAWPRNRITGTIPPAGKVVLSDSAITFYVASGPAICTLCSGTGRVVNMPPICGLTFQQANTVLVEMGITLDQHPIRRPSSKEAGTVIGSVPAVGTRFSAYGSRNAEEVVVTISSGQAGPTAGSQASC
jgi:beta-lactam-binding protein with PASTA domain